MSTDVSEVRTDFIFRGEKPAVSSLAYPLTLMMEPISSFETSADSTGLPGVTSQKVILIIVTASRTSNATRNKKFWKELIAYLIRHGPN
jgi:hypothetical protein